MELKRIVALYATRNAKGVEIDLESLSKDKKFRSEAVKQVLKKVQEIPHVCIVFPSFKRGEEKNPLGGIINELARSLQIESLVTENLQQVKQLRMPAENVILIKHSFRSGKKLKEQVEELKELGCNVSVICLIAHSSAKVEAFAHENNVKVDALVYTDEINYLWCPNRIDIVNKEKLKKTH